MVTGLVLAFLTSQLLRVGSVFLGAGVGLLETGTAIGLLLVPVLSWALAPAFGIAVFSVASRMAADGEIVALDASGMNRIRLALGPLVLALGITCLSAWLWLDAAPRSQAILRGSAFQMASKAVIGKIEAGRFLEPVRGIAFYADQKEGYGKFRGVLLEDMRDRGHQVQFVAKKARLMIHPASLMLKAQLKEGSAFVATDALDRSPTALSFESLDFKVPLADEIERRLDFLPGLLAVPTATLAGPPPNGQAVFRWRYALGRRVAGPLGFFALALLSIVLSFGSGWRRRGAAQAFAIGLFLVYHLLCRLFESLMQAEVMGPLAAALGPAIIVFAFLIILLVRPNRRKPVNQ